MEVWHHQRACPWLQDFQNFDLHELFVDWPQEVYIRTLQFKIYTYASELLTIKWDDLNYTLNINDSLFTRIKDDILPKQLKEKQNNVRYNLRVQAMTWLVYRKAFELALIGKMLCINARLQQKLPLDIASGVYVFIPTKFQRGGLESLVLSVSRHQHGFDVPGVVFTVQPLMPVLEAKPLAELELNNLCQKLGLFQETSLNYSIP